MPRRAPVSILVSSAAVVGCLMAGCGGSSAPVRPVAERICDGARRAASADLKVPAHARISSRAPANVVCLTRAGRTRLRIVSQASPQAFTAFNTETAHQSQVFGSGVHQLNRTPVQVIVPRAVAAVWVAGQSELIATNATPTHPHGAYVVITVSGARGAAARSAALAAARATFAARPGTA